MKSPLKNKPPIIPPPELHGPLLETRNKNSPSLSSSTSTSNPKNSPPTSSTYYPTKSLPLTPSSSSHSSLPSLSFTKKSNRSSPNTTSTKTYSPNPSPTSNAFQLLSKRIPCRIEGRDVGQDLIRLCKKHSSPGDSKQKLSQSLQLHLNQQAQKLSPYKLDLLSDKITAINLQQMAHSLTS